MQEDQPLLYFSKIQCITIFLFITQNLSYKILGRLDGTFLLSHLLILESSNLKPLHQLWLAKANETATYLEEILVELFQVTKIQTKTKKTQRILPL